MQLPFAVNIWPFPETTPLTFIFISSIFAAAAASTLWAAASENYGALAGIGLDYLVILTPVAILSFQQGAISGNPRMTAYGIACLFGSFFGLGLLLWSIRIPIDNTIPMPGLVRWSFVLFIIALLIVSSRLILKVPNVIPWKITPELSAVIGWMFLGAAMYFAYALVRPSWVNAAGQLAGFLAYDVVLIVPFLQRLPTVAPEHQVGLIIYIAVICYSGLLAIYYLLIHKSTRLWAGTPAKQNSPEPGPTLPSSANSPRAVNMLCNRPAALAPPAQLGGQGVSVDRLIQAEVGVSFEQLDQDRRRPRRLLLAQGDGRRLSPASSRRTNTPWMTQAR
ncbi:MAG: hypothetical protein KDE09_17555 [Anaerolineales bacterium]|nr:hypothetical protein [Anaerolineales bacterium]